MATSPIWHRDRTPSNGSDRANEATLAHTSRYADGQGCNSRHLVLCIQVATWYAGNIAFNVGMKECLAAGYGNLNQLA